MKHPLLLALLFCAFLVSCDKDDPVAPTAPITTIGDSLSIARVDDRSANASWNTVVPGTTSIMIAWEPAGAPASRDSMQLQLDAKSHRLRNLVPETDYAVSVTIRNTRGDAVVLPGFLKGIDRPIEPVRPANPSGLEAAALSSSSVGVRWTASSTVGAGYLVSYRKVGASDTASSSVAGSGILISGNSAIVTGLSAGAYTFYVFAQSDSGISTGASMTWAPATRYTQDAASPSVSLRMYETASVGGAGLIIDPAKGGPRNANVSQSSSDPAGSIALAIYTGTGTPANSFDIGPAYAFTAYRNADKFDSSSYISNNGFSVAGLDDLYLRKSLDTYITAGGAEAGNIRAFTLPATSTDGKGVAFLMRGGNGAGMHYMRVLVRADASGRLLRGTAPNRYAEVEISYQAVAGIPYAKGVVRRESRPTFTSRPLYPPK